MPVLSREQQHARYESEVQEVHEIDRHGLVRVEVPQLGESRLDAMRREPVQEVSLRLPRIARLLQQCLVASLGDLFEIAHRCEFLLDRLKRARVLEVRTKLEDGPRMGLLLGLQIVHVLVLRVADVAWPLCLAPLEATAHLGLRMVGLEGEQERVANPRLEVRFGTYCNGALDSALATKGTSAKAALSLPKCAWKRSPQEAVFRS